MGVSRAALFVIVSGLAGVTAVYALSLPSLSLRPVLYSVTEKSPQVESGTLPATAVPVDLRPALVHIAQPSAVKAIYMSQCYAATPSLREKLLHIADTTEVNSIIVDIKDYTGTISFSPQSTSVLSVGYICDRASYRVPRPIPCKEVSRMGGKAG
jgi:Putative glycosyl hydrolase domain